MHCAIVLAATMVAGTFAKAITKEEFDEAAKKGQQFHSPLMATLCQDQNCDDAMFPIMDYDPATKKCRCTAHPCWNDNGQAHHCNTARLPFLTFSYTKEGKLQCGCRATPDYMSRYIAQVKCPGHSCEGNEEAPMLDYSEFRKCICRPHMCTDLDGLAHKCSDPKLPLLHYREEKINGQVKKICECKALHKARTDEL